MITPTRTFGLSTDRLKVLAAAALSLSLTVVSNAPNRAVAASTAVAIAMPLVIALVVFRSRPAGVSTCAPSPSTSPDISAMPCALSVTGPNESMVTITPTVVSRPVPVSATAKKAICGVVVGEQVAPKPRRRSAAPRRRRTPSRSRYPDRMDRGAPVSELSPMSRTGLRLSR